MSDTAVRVTDLAKRFRIHHQRDTSLKGAVLRGRRSIHEDFWAFEDVSFDVPKGSSLAILGSNGSGKSTLLKCMARILVPDRGSITTEGNVAAMLELGAAFHPELSGHDNIFLQAAILGLDRGFVQSRLDQIISFADIGEFIDQPVKNYSSGMYGRLGFAVAVHLDPDVLLIDEVLAVGDRRFQRQCFDRFAQLRQDGKSLVLVTHNVGAAQSMCDYGLWLEKGRTHMFGPIDEVSRAYLGDGDDEPPGLSEQPNDPPSAASKPSGFIRDVELLDASGETVARVLTGSYCRVRVTLAPTGDSSPIILALALVRSDQLMITRTASTDAIHCSGTETVVEVEFDDLFVLPGRYGWSVAVQSAADLSRTYETAHLARVFEVGGEVRQGVSGAVRMDGKWTVIPAPVVDAGALESLDAGSQP